MLPFTKSDITPIGRAVAADNDTSEVLFDGTKALVANDYENARAVALVDKSASNASCTVQIKFYEKDTADGAVGTWTLVEAETAEAIADAAGYYKVEATIPMRKVSKKYVTAQVTLVLTDPGTDIVAVAGLLVGEIARRA